MFGLNNLARVIRAGVPSLLRQRLELSQPLQFSVQKNCFSSTQVNQSLEEFFEVEKFRGEKVIRVGREWR